MCACHLLVLYPTCALEYVVPWQPCTPCLDPVATLLWSTQHGHWCVPGVMLQQHPISCVSAPSLTCPPAGLFPVTVLPWLPAVVSRFPLYAQPPASVPLFFGGLCLSVQWQWTSSGLAKPTNMSTVQWGFNLIFPNEVFNPALGRRPSFRISSSLCTLRPPWCSL